MAGDATDLNVVNMKGKSSSLILNSVNETFYLLIDLDFDNHELHDN